MMRERPARRHTPRGGLRMIGRPSRRHTTMKTIVTPNPIIRVRNLTVCELNLALNNPYFGINMRSHTINERSFTVCELSRTIERLNLAPC